MNVSEPGVLPGSQVYLHMPTEFARRHLFYSHIGGAYHCDAPYQVQRDYLESYIIFLVTEGQLDVDYRSQQLQAGPGQVVVLDCKYPQTYGMSHPGQFKWFHFTGNASQAYADLLYASKGAIIEGADPAVIGPMIDPILQMMAEDTVDEHRVSSLVHQIFAELLSTRHEPYRYADPVVRAAIAFIESHARENITLEQIAASVNLSPFHFARIFKKHTACTPHEYLTNTRLKQAMQMLKQSRLSLDNIADQCGFNSATHFIRCFRQHLDMTPGQYRQLRF